MKILDWYILKRYLFTFGIMLLLFIPIAITVHLAEKIGKILEHQVPVAIVMQYFLDFTIHFAHMLYPLFLFLSVIWFTSKLANNTEIVAFLSSGVSYVRFLRPYLIGATIVALLAVILGMFIAPTASKGFNDFNSKYLKGGGGVKSKTTEIFKQITDEDIIYVSRFDSKKNMGYNFTLEHYLEDKMVYKISANSIKFIPEDTTYRLRNYTKRIIGIDEDIIDVKRKQDTIFPFELEDLVPVDYIAETLKYGELVRFINREEKRGSNYIGRYKLAKYRKWSLPISVFVLTIIAVAVSSKKRRGGMGINLAFGITIAMAFVFFDKIFGTMASQSDFSPLIAVWFPNFIFGILAFVLLRNAKR